MMILYSFTAHPDVDLEAILEVAKSQECFEAALEIGWKEGWKVHATGVIWSGYEVHAITYEVRGEHL
jgi:hypothetical protein